MSSRELLASAADDLARVGCASPQVDAEWLLAHALGVTRTELYANGAPAAEDEKVFRELFAGLEGPFDLVVSNPPYVEPAEIDLLEPEVVRYEPREALVASGATEEIAEGARARLAPGGRLVLETADGRAQEVAGLLRRL